MMWGKRLSAAERRRQRVLLEDLGLALLWTAVAAIFVFVLFVGVNGPAWGINTESVDARRMTSREAVARLRVNLDRAAQTMRTRAERRTREEDGR